MKPKHVVGAAVAALSLAWPMVAAKPALAADPVTVPFAYSGDEQVWTVPEGVDSIHVVLSGAPGGSCSVPGGFGARVEGDLIVSAGTHLYVEVGGTASCGSAAGFNGGGNSWGPSGSSGGGASDLRTVTRADATSLASRLVVAGGGGGGGAGTNGSSGGNAGQPGGDPPGGTAFGGGAGTAVGGGAGGPGASGIGSAGALGVGGSGATSVDGAAYGGGGGGGYYGGGGGGADSSHSAGGGGGSSYAGDAQNALVATDNSGVPSITISYLASQPDSGTVAAQVTVPSSAACLELSTTSVDFGVLPLGSEDQPGGPAIDVTNCSSVGETVFARATDATGGGASWGLVDSSDTCNTPVALATDTYRLGLSKPLESLSVSTANKALASLASGATETRTARIYTACPGSSGAGTTMSMQIVFLATE